MAITGNLFKLVHLWNPKLILTSGGQSLYDWQVGGTHPHILLECFLVYFWNYYRPQTKLWEDNVFTPVCLSTGGGGVRSHGNNKPLGQHTYTPDNTPPWTAAPDSTPPVNKRPARILLESFLVCFVSTLCLSPNLGGYSQGLELNIIINKLQIQIN